MQKHPQQTIPSLDGWRALAITIVFVSHCGLDDLIPGGLGVTIFFFLSGFLITTLLIDECQRTGTINIKFFYLRRLVRLMPPLFLTLGLAYTAAANGVIEGRATVAGFLSQLFYFSNYYSLFFDIGNTTPVGTGIFWSLAVEEHFYLFFPLLALLLIKRGKPAQSAAVMLSLCIACLLWRVWVASHNPNAAERIYYASDTRLDSLLYGCFLAFFRNDTRVQAVFSDQHSSKWILMSLLVLGSTLIFRGEFFRETLRYSVQGMALVPLFFYSTTRQPLTIFKPLNTKAAKKIGVQSYSIYLCHFALIRKFLYDGFSPWISYTAALLFSLLYATFMTSLVDPYFQKFRVKFRP
jgi:peptidoglycan/LPS O-acetylase OafA/YrhL